MALVLITVMDGVDIDDDVDGIDDGGFDWDGVKDNDDVR